MTQRLALALAFVSICALSACERSIVHTGPMPKVAKSPGPTALPKGLLAERIPGLEEGADHFTRYRLRTASPCIALQLVAQLREGGRIVQVEQGKRRLVPADFRSANLMSWDGCGLFLDAKGFKDARGQLDIVVGIRLEQARGSRPIKVFALRGLDVDGLVAKAAAAIARDMDAPLGLESEAAKDLETVIAEDARAQIGAPALLLSARGVLRNNEIPARAVARAVWPKRHESGDGDFGEGVTLGAVLFDEAEESLALSLAERIKQAPRAVVFLVRGNRAR